jgi:hypothetical protein
MLEGPTHFAAAGELRRLRANVDQLDYADRLALANVHAQLAIAAAVIELAKTVAAATPGGAGPYPRADWDVVLGYSEYEHEELATAADWRAAAEDPGDHPDELRATPGTR